MAAITFNISLGKSAYYAGLPAASDSLIAVLLASSGLVSDATMRDYDTLAALLAGASDEATFTGYSRNTLTGVNVTVDDTNDRVDIDCDDTNWSPTTAQALGKIVICYVPSSGAADSSIVPLFADDFSLTTPTSGTVTYQVASGGFLRAS
jgi:hypothetical protein